MLIGLVKPFLAFLAFPDMFSPNPISGLHHLYNVA
jgi:hypothetical protein